MHGQQARAAVSAVLFTMAATVASFGVTAPAGATDTTVPVATAVPEPVQSPGIIPAPNSGREPRHSGDRGGSEQTILFFGLLVAATSIAGLIVRDSRRQLAKRADAR